MSANINPIFPLVIQQSAQTFVLADTTTIKVLFTAGLNGSRIDAIVATSTDTINQLFTVILYDGVTAYNIGELTVIANCGTDGATKAMSLLSLLNFPFLDASGSLYLKNGWSLRLALKTGAIASGKTVTFVTMGGDY